MQKNKTPNQHKLIERQGHGKFTSIFAREGK
jgi:hypothetical protein